MNYKYIIIFVLLLLPVATFAQYQPLVGIPGVGDANADLDTYINKLYALSISIAALLAVIKIIIAGVKWMLTDVVTSKEDAKKDIWGATLGLLLVISAVLILNVINPQLTKLNLFIAPADPVGAPNNPPAIDPTKANCLKDGGKWIDTTADITVPGGYCVPKSAPKPISEFYSCIDPDDLSGPMNCPKAKQRCINDGGTPSDSYSKGVDAKLLTYQIECTPKFAQ